MRTLPKKHLKFSKKMQTKLHGGGGKKMTTTKGTTKVAKSYIKGRFTKKNKKKV